MLNRHIDVRAYNREAWNHQVDSGNEWTVPVSPETIATVREGRWHVLLIPVPREWFPAMSGADVLCLACGGGQQGPIFAAAGANVTVFDNSPRQLAQDRLVAEREGLTIRTVEGDMADLSAFADGSFDLVFHPVSNVFAEDVLPVWREAYRVLRPGGILLTGFMNPAIYIFDFALADEKGIFEVAHISQSTGRWSSATASTSRSADSSRRASCSPASSRIATRRNRTMPSAGSCRSSSPRGPSSRWCNYRFDVV
jgi:SAM-dependent methyltransferase